MRAMVSRSENHPRILIEFARFTHNGRVTKIRTRCVRNVYVCYHSPLETIASASDHLGVDCPAGRKKATRKHARLPLVLGVPAISPHIFTHDGKHTRIRSLPHRF